MDTNWETLKQNPKSIFYKDFRPTANRIGFIKSDIETLANEFELWRKQLNNPQAYKKTKLNTELSESFKLLLPLNTQFVPKWLFVETNSEWVGIFNNSKLGSDVFSTVSYLSERMKTYGIEVFANEDSNEEYGGLGFSYYGPDKTEWLNVIRSILCHNDDPWKFFERGTPFDFEDTSVYTSKKVKDRFNLELLMDYVKHFNIDFANVDFYKNNSYLLDRISDKFYKP